MCIDMTVDAGLAGACLSCAAVVAAVFVLRGVCVVCCSCLCCACGCFWCACSWCVSYWYEARAPHSEHRERSRKTQHGRGGGGLHVSAHHLVGCSSRMFCSSVGVAWLLCRFELYSLSRRALLVALSIFLQNDAYNLSFAYIIVCSSFLLVQIYYKPFKVVTQHNNNTTHTEHTQHTTQLVICAVLVWFVLCVMRIPCCVCC